MVLTTYEKHESLLSTVANNPAFFSKAEVAACDDDLYYATYKDDDTPREKGTAPAVRMPLTVHWPHEAVPPSHRGGGGSGGNEYWESFGPAGSAKMQAGTTEL